MFVVPYFNFTIYLPAEAAMTPMALCSADSFFRVYLAPLSLKLPVNCTKYKVGIEVMRVDVSVTRDTLGTARLSIPGHNHLHVVLLEVHL